MKAYKIELFVIDMDNIGIANITSELENARYSNHCISPEVKGYVEKDIGEWHDDHPLNFTDSKNVEYIRLFKNNE